MGLLLWVLYILYVFLSMMTQEMVMNGYFAYFPELMKWVEWEREHGVPGVYNASHPQPSIYEYYPPGTQAVQAGMGIVGIAFFLLTCVLTCQLRAMVRQRDQIKPSTCGEGFGPGCDDCCCACCCMCRAGADAPPTACRAQTTRCARRRGRPPCEQGDDKHGLSHGAGAPRAGAGVGGVVELLNFSHA